MIAVADLCSVSVCHHKRSCWCEGKEGCAHHKPDVQAQCRKQMKSLDKEIAQAEKHLRFAEAALHEKEANAQALTSRLKEAQTRQEVRCSVLLWL